ncbi:hypothetical protein B0H14DRAFT_3425603 [Mycena olivaceomarginata]|nr:hypothetical protein B0H14DRAFT_3425603 [Mycena olivaceomarginata]
MAEKADKSKKHGSPSNFQGQQGVFLESWMEAYCEVLHKKTTAKMWDRLFPQYWANFSWHSRTKELVGPIFMNTDEDWVVFAMPKEILTPEEETRKKEVVKGTQGHVATEPKVDVQIMVLNAGKTKGENGQTFPAWDAGVYTSTFQGFSCFVWAAPKAKLLQLFPPPPVPTPDGNIILPDASAAQTLQDAATTTSTVADPPPANDDMEIDSPEHNPFEGLTVNPHLSEYEFVHANNIAQNTEMITSLGLNKTFKEALGLPLKKAGTRKSGQKLGGRGGGGRKAKQARGEGERSLSKEEDDKEDDEEDEEE